jgi:hypothetical protein
MAVGNDDVFHNIQLSMASPGFYWHVYPRNFEANAANPASNARLAWRDGKHAMFYTGETPAVALWETVLRNASIVDGWVTTPREHLEGRMLVRLELMASVDVLDLRPPHRRALVTAETDLEVEWQHMLTTPDHASTHAFTTRAMAQLAAAGHVDGAAMRWYSRQAGNGVATLFYAPPMQSSWWKVDPAQIYALDSPEGEKQICLALEPQGLRWSSPPGGADFKPGPDPDAP